MKKQQLLLTNPCTENWDEMTPSKQGRYCASCEKHIVDLTTKSDEEILHFFNRKKNNICARLLATQLHRDLITPPKKYNWQWLIPVALGAMSTIPSKAMKLKPVITQTDRFNSTNADIAPYLNPKILADSIKGTVLAKDTNTPLSGVKIKNKRFKNVIALTDENGNFSLPYNKGEVAETIIFELPGYVLLEQIISTDTVIKMLPVKIMLGAVTTISTNTQPLYVITFGKKSCFASDLQSNNILPEWIEKIDVLKGASATATYGYKAANGVIVIKLKEQYFDKVDFLKKN